MSHSTVPCLLVQGPDRGFYYREDPTHLLPYCGCGVPSAVTAFIRLPTSGTNTGTRVCFGDEEQCRSPVTPYRKSSSHRVVNEAEEDGDGSGGRVYEGVFKRASVCGTRTSSEDPP